MDVLLVEKSMILGARPTRRPGHPASAALHSTSVISPGKYSPSNHSFSGPYIRKIANQLFPWMTAPISLRPLSIPEKTQIDAAAKVRIVRWAQWIDATLQLEIKNGVFRWVGDRQKRPQLGRSIPKNECLNTPKAVIHASRSERRQ